MEERETLWLPDGYGVGTIIYDLENVPHEAQEHTKAGANILYIVEVNEAYADMQIEKGAPVLRGTKE